MLPLEPILMVGPEGITALAEWVVTEGRSGLRFKTGRGKAGMVPDLDRQGRLARALSVPEVARWHANLAERSELTADIYARRLDRFCEDFNTTYGALCSLDSKSAHNLLVDAVRHYRARRLGGSTIKGYLKPVVSWLLGNEVVLTGSVYVSGRRM